VVALPGRGRPGEHAKDEKRPSLALRAR